MGKLKNFPKIKLLAEYSDWILIFRVSSLWNKTFKNFGHLMAEKMSESEIQPTHHCMILYINRMGATKKCAGFLSTQYDIIY